MKRTIFIVSLLFILNTNAQNAPIAIQNEIQSNLDVYQQALQNQGVIVPGWIVKVEKVGEWQQKFTNGFSNSSMNTQLNGTEKFRIGNITQTFIGVAFMKLVQNNTININNSITSYLPINVTTLIPNAATVTVKQLLQHTSGIAGYNDSVIQDGEPTASEITVDWYSSNFLNNYSFSTIMNNYFTLYQPVSSPSATIYNYSETNYLLLGEIIFNATGLTWQQYITQNIIIPLNLNNTSCILDNVTANVPSIMSGYIPTQDLDGNETLLDATIQNNSIYKASRGMISTVDDLNIFWKSVCLGEIIPLNLTQQLQTFSAFPDGDTTSFGFGLGCLQVNQGYNWIGNEGVIEGYTSCVYYLPTLNVYVSVANNSLFSTLPIVAIVENSINQYNLSTTNFNTNLISIFPNPTSDYFTINSNSSNIFKIAIYDSLGKLIKNYNNIPSQTKVDISELEKGIYFLNVKNETLNFNTKIIKS